MDRLQIAAVAAAVALIAVSYLFRPPAPPPEAAPVEREASAEAPPSASDAPPAASPELALPESKQAKPGASDTPLVVTIAQQEPYYYLGARPVTLDRLQQELASSVARNPKISISLRADAKAQLQQILKVMDAARAANIKTPIELFAKPPGQQ